MSVIKETQENNNKRNTGIEPVFENIPDKPVPEQEPNLLSNNTNSNNTPPRQNSVFPTPNEVRGLVSDTQQERLNQLFGGIDNDLQRADLRPLTFGVDSTEAVRGQREAQQLFNSNVNRIIRDRRLRQEEIRRLNSIDLRVEAEQEKKNGRINPILSWTQNALGWLLGDKTGEFNPKLFGGSYGDYGDGFLSAGLYLLDSIDNVPRAFINDLHDFLDDGKISNSERRRPGARGNIFGFDVENKTGLRGINALLGYDYSFTQNPSDENRLGQVTDIETLSSSRTMGELRANRDKLGFFGRLFTDPLHPLSLLPDDTPIPAWMRGAGGQTSEFISGLILDGIVTAGGIDSIRQWGKNLRATPNTPPTPQPNLPSLPESSSSKVKIYQGEIVNDQQQLPGNLITPPSQEEVASAARRTSQRQADDYFSFRSELAEMSDAELKQKYGFNDDDILQFRQRYPRQDNLLTPRESKKPESPELDVPTIYDLQEGREIELRQGDFNAGIQNQTEALIRREAPQFVEGELIEGLPPQSTDLITLPPELEAKLINHYRIQYSNRGFRELAPYMPPDILEVLGERSVVGVNSLSEEDFIRLTLDELELRQSLIPPDEINEFRKILPQNLSDGISDDDVLRYIGIRSKQDLISNRLDQYIEVYYQKLDDLQRLQRNINEFKSNNGRVTNPLPAQAVENLELPRKLPEPQSTSISDVDKLVDFQIQTLLTEEPQEFINLLNKHGIDNQLVFQNFITSDDLGDLLTTKYYEITNNIQDSNNLSIIERRLYLGDDLFNELAQELHPYSNLIPEDGLLKQLLESGDDETKQILRNYFEEGLQNTGSILDDVDQGKWLASDIQSQQPLPTRKYSDVVEPEVLPPVEDVPDINPRKQLIQETIDSLDEIESVQDLSRKLDEVKKTIPGYLHPKINDALNKLKNFSGNDFELENLLDDIYESLESLLADSEVTPKPKLNPKPQLDSLDFRVVDDDYERILDLIDYEINRQGGAGKAARIQDIQGLLEDFGYIVDPTLKRELFQRLRESGLVVDLNQGLIYKPRKSIKVRAGQPRPKRVINRKLVSSEIIGSINRLTAFVKKYRTTALRNTLAFQQLDSAVKYLPSIKQLNINYDTRKTSQILKQLEELADSIVPTEIKQSQRASLYDSEFFRQGDEARRLSSEKLRVSVNQELNKITAKNLEEAKLLNKIKTASEALQENLSVVDDKKYLQSILKNKDNILDMTPFNRDLNNITGRRKRLFQRQLDSLSGSKNQYIKAVQQRLDELSSSKTKSQLVDAEYQKLTSDEIAEEFTDEDIYGTSSDVPDDDYFRQLDSEFGGTADESSFKEPTTREIGTVEAKFREAPKNLDVEEVFDDFEPTDNKLFSIKGYDQMVQNIAEKVTTKEKKLALYITKFELFHGTKQTLDLNITPKNTGARAELGQGLYLTTNRTLADLYSRATPNSNIPGLERRVLGESKVYQVSSKLQKPLDADEHLRKRMQNVFSDQLSKRFNLGNSRPNQWGIDKEPIRKIKKFLDKETTSFKEIMKFVDNELSDLSESHKLTVHKFFTEGLEKFGYDSIVEIVGKRKTKRVQTVSVLRPSRIDIVNQGKPKSVLYRDNPELDSRLARYIVDKVSEQNNPGFDYLKQSAEESKLRFGVANTKEKAKKIDSLINDLSKSSEELAEQESKMRKSARKTKAQRRKAKEEKANKQNETQLKHNNKPEEDIC